MSANWSLRRLSEVADFQNHRRVPLKSLDRQKRQGKYPYYGASGVVDHIDDYIFDGTFLLISEDGENLRTRKTPIAFKASGKFWVNNHAHILQEKEEGILDYLEYYFSTLDLTPFITGAVQPKLNKANLDTIEIPVPPNDERLKINQVLNSFTNKIELNTQTNQTLEQIAQAIFKSWFVDFEPVKAKIAVLEAGLPAPVRISGGPREGIFCTYVIECDDGSYYIGQTDNLKRRWREHLSGEGAQWTKTHKPLQIAHFEENSSREEAVAKEKNWKTTSGRRELKKLIASGAARQAGGTAEQAELAAMSVISAKDEAALKQLQAEQPDAYAELAQTAALFPSALVDSELGEIPEGWEVKNLPDVMDFLEGPGIRNWQYTSEEDGVRFINIRCIKSGDLKLETANKITKEEAFGKYAHFQLQEDDIVVSTSGTLGRYAFVRQEHLPLSLNTSVIRFRSIENVSTLHFMAGYIDTELQLQLEMRASGSAQRNFGPMHLKQINMLLPKIELLGAHKKLLEPIFRLRQSNLKEIDDLSNLRNTLLPKLLAGHLPITNTEVA